MDTGTQTIATFTGTLLRREHNVGQKFVQLVFRENDQNWLCISSKLTHAKLAIGQKYHIEGVFRQYGERTYIHEPAIDAAETGFSKRRMVAVAIAATGILIVTAGMLIALHAHSHALNATDTSVHTALPQTPVTTSSSAATQQTTATDTTQTTAPAATTPTATTPKKATTSKTTTNSTNSTSQAPAPTVAQPSSQTPSDTTTTGTPSVPVDQPADQGADTTSQPTNTDTNTTPQDTSADTPTV